MSTMHEKLERMTQEEILVKTVVVIQGLEALKSDHDFMLHNLTETIKCLNEGEMAGLVHEKFSLLQTSVDKIKLGLEEAKVMTALAANLRELELEKCELQLQVCQLEQEKMQLKEHVNYVQEKLQTSEQNFAQVEEEKNHLQFMNELKQYNLEPFLENGEVEEILQNNLDELFPNEEETNQEPSQEQEGSMAIAAVQQEDDRVPGHLKTLHNLVIRYAQKGHYEVAVPLCKQTLASLERTLGHDHPDVATMLNILALVYRNQGKHEEASRLLYDVVAIRMKTLGEEHPMVAGTLNNLSVQYGKMGRFIEAEPICKRALELKEKVLGIDHPEVAKQLNNLGLICEKQEKYEEVESYLCRAIDIYEKNLCQDDPQFDKTKNNLASCYLKQGKYKEAEILYKEILTRAHKKEFGTVDAENKPIWMYAEEGRGAAGNHSHHAEYREGQVTSPTINIAMRKLAEAYRYQGKNEAADIMEEFNTRPRKQSSFAIVQRLKDADESRRSFSDCVKYEPRDDGIVAWNRGTNLRRYGSLSKMREVLRRSSEMLVKKLQDTVLQDSPNPNLKRAASLNFLDRTGGSQTLQSGSSGRRLRDSRPRSSSTVELHNNTEK